jgi:adenylyltransferase/sulfurtransferase
MGNGTVSFGKRVRIVGLGALGSEAARLLCLAGAGTLILQDFDIVQKENLRCQPLYAPGDVGTHKTDAARAHLLVVRPETAIETITAPFGPHDTLTGCDVAIDGTDALDVKLQLNAAARAAKAPLVVGALGHASGFAFTVGAGPCLACVMHGKAAQDDCTRGVPLALAHAVASEQARMALRALAGEHEEALLAFDREGKSRRIAVRRHPACPVCSGARAIAAREFSLRACEGTGRLHARPGVPLRVDLHPLRARGTLADFGNAVRVPVGAGSALVYEHGLVEFENVGKEEAERFLAGLGYPLTGE